MVERWPEEPSVTGPIPVLATNSALRLGTHSNFLIFKYWMIYRKLNRQILKAVAIKQNECLEKS